MNHTMVEGRYKVTDECRARQVDREEPSITFGGDWGDVEADGVDAGGNVTCGSSEDTEDNGPQRKIKWGQLGGVIQRGAPASLMLA